MSADRMRAGIYLFVAGAAALFTFWSLVTVAGDAANGQELLGRMLPPLALGIGALFSLEAAWRANRAGDGPASEGACARCAGQPLAGSVLIVGNGAAGSSVVLERGRLEVRVGDGLRHPDPQAVRLLR